MNPLTYAILIALSFPVSSYEDMMIQMISTGYRPLCTGWDQ